MKYFLSLILCLFAVNSWGFAPGFLATATHQVAAGGGGGAWYYPGAFGESGFTTGGAWATGEIAGSVITPSVSGNVTKLSVNMNSTTPTGCKVAIYTAVQTSALLSTGGTFDPTATGWNDVTITPYAVTSGTSYAVEVMCNTSWNMFANTTSATNGFYGNATYSSFPGATNTIYINSSGQTEGVRMWIE